MAGNCGVPHAQARPQLCIDRGVSIRQTRPTRIVRCRRLRHRVRYRRMPKSLSPAMTAATRRERRRLEGYREKLYEQLRRAKHEVERLEAEIRNVDNQARLLERLLDDRQTAAPEAEASAAGEVLQGARLRQVAVQLLATRAGARRAVHYREWYGWLGEAGYVVLGKRPPAAFLTAISRSPVIRRGEEPGTYLLDPQAVAELEDAQREVLGERADLDGVLSRERDSAPGLLRHRDELNRRLRRLDSQIDEANAALAAVEQRRRPQLVSNAA